MTGAERKRAGIALTTTANREFIQAMRAYARQRSSRAGEVHIDHVRKFAERKGMKPKSSAAWGAIFSQPGWKQTGEYRPSRIPSNHRHRSPVWVWRASS